MQSQIMLYEVWIQGTTPVLWQNFQKHLGFNNKKIV